MSSPVVAQPVAAYPETGLWSKQSLPRPQPPSHRLGYGILNFSPREQLVEVSQLAPACHRIVLCPLGLHSGGPSLRSFVFPALSPLFPTLESD